MTAAPPADLGISLHMRLMQLRQTPNSHVFRGRSPFVSEGDTLEGADFPFSARVLDSSRYLLEFYPRMMAKWPSTQEEARAAVLAALLALRARVPSSASSAWFPAPADLSDEIRLALISMLSRPLRYRSACLVLFGGVVDHALPLPKVSVPPRPPLKLPSSSGPRSSAPVKTPVSKSPSKAASSSRPADDPAGPKRSLIRTFLGSTRTKTASSAPPPDPASLRLYAPGEDQDLSGGYPVEVASEPLPDLGDLPMDSDISDDDDSSNIPHYFLGPPPAPYMSVVDYQSGPLPPPFGSSVDDVAYAPLDQSYVPLPPPVPTPPGLPPTHPIITTPAGSTHTIHTPTGPIMVSSGPTPLSRPYRSGGPPDFYMDERTAYLEQEKLRERDQQLEKMMRSQPAPVRPAPGANLSLFDACTAEADLKTHAALDSIVEMFASGLVADRQWAESLVNTVQAPHGHWLSAQFERYQRFLWATSHTLTDEELPSDLSVALDPLRASTAALALMESAVAENPALIALANVLIIKPRLDPPVEVQLLWRAHLCAPLAYASDCLRLCGRIVDCVPNTSAVSDKERERIRQETVRIIDAPSVSTAVRTWFSDTPSLNADAWSLIACYLPLRDLGRLARCSSLCRRAAYSDPAWIHRPFLDVTPLLRPSQAAGGCVAEMMQQDSAVRRRPAREVWLARAIMGAEARIRAVAAENQLRNRRVMWGD